MAAPETIRLRVNGRAVERPAGCTVDSLIDHLGLDRRYLVVEINGEAAALVDVGTRSLAAGDNVELVRPVAGG